MKKHSRAPPPNHNHLYFRTRPPMILSEDALKGIFTVEMCIKVPSAQHPSPMC